VLPNVSEIVKVEEHEKKPPSGSKEYRNSIVNNIGKRSARQ
jgi:hypothetical protein